MIHSLEMHSLQSIFTMMKFSFSNLRCRSFFCFFFLSYVILDLWNMIYFKVKRQKIFQRDSLFLPFWALAVLSFFLSSFLAPIFISSSSPVHRLFNKEDHRSSRNPMHCHLEQVSSSRPRSRFALVAVAVVDRCHSCCS